MSRKSSTTLPLVLSIESSRVGLAWYLLLVGASLLSVLLVVHRGHPWPGVCALVLALYCLNSLRDYQLAGQVLIADAEGAWRLGVSYVEAVPVTLAGQVFPWCVIVSLGPPEPSGKPGQCGTRRAIVFNDSLPRNELSALRRHLRLQG